jgi:ATP-binding cassette, subfamily B, bacterial
VYTAISVLFLGEPFVMASVLRLGPFLMGVLAPYCHYFVILIASIFFWALGMSLKPYAVKEILDHLTKHDPITFFVAFYIFLMCCDVLINRIYDYYGAQLLPSLKTDIFEKMMDYVLGHSHGYFQDHFPGAISNRMNDMAHGVSELVSISLDRFLSNIFAFLIAIFAFCSVSLVLGGILLLWMLVYLFLTLCYATRIHKLSYQSSAINSQILGRIVDVLSNNMIVRFFSARPYEQSQVRHLLKSYRHRDRAMRLCMMRLYIFQGISFTVMLSGCLIYLMYGYDDGWVTVGDFALILTLSISVIESLWGISEDFSQFSEQLGKVTQGLSVIYEPHDIVDNAEAKTLEVTKGSIQWHEMCFHYKHPTSLFENITLSISGGEKVGLVGLSGSGKTTFVNLLLRLYDLNAGSICIDGQNIAGVTQESLRAQLGMIPQEVQLFHRSIIDNIRYGQHDASDEAVIEAAKKAHADEFIMALEEGYYTEVGCRGLKLSGGQRQRIGIARALLKNAPILLLDEATSALDTVTEKHIQDSLNILMRDKTCIIIAHRLSTLQHVDRILVFEQGAIVEDGKHHALLALNGVYARLWNSQIGGFIE